MRTSLPGEDYEAVLNMLGLSAFEASEREMSETQLDKWVPRLEERSRMEGDVCESSVSRCIRHRGCG